jgi:hypothetical protein
MRLRGTGAQELHPREVCRDFVEHGLQRGAHRLGARGAERAFEQHALVPVPGRERFGRSVVTAFDRGREPAEQPVRLARHGAHDERDTSLAERFLRAVGDRLQARRTGDGGASELHHAEHVRDSFLKSERPRRWAGPSRAEETSSLKRHAGRRCCASSESSWS